MVCMKVIIVSDKARYFNTLALGQKSAASSNGMFGRCYSLMAWRHYIQVPGWL